MQRAPSTLTRTARLTLGCVGVFGISYQGAFGETFVCHDSSYNRPVIVTVDMQQKSLKIDLTTNQSGVKCTIFVKDGSYSRVIVGENADFCSLLIGKDSLHQSVTSNNGHVIAKILSTNTNTALVYDLDLNTGIFDEAGSIIECHRPHV